MNDHHFSYPRVVPLPGATISGHATQPPAPIAPSLHQVPVPKAATAPPAPKLASLAA
jgi:hypothetical protein